MSRQVACESLLDKLKRITFITKSKHPIPHKSVPWSQEQLTHIRELQEKYSRVAEEFAEVFSARATGIDICHIPLVEFLQNSAEILKHRDHLICPIGGDGTFLLAAQKILDDSHHCLAINPEPEKSIGQLCGFTYDAFGRGKEAAELLFECLVGQQFEVLRRTRIETTNLTNREAEYPLGTLHLPSPQRNSALRHQLQPMPEIHVPRQQRYSPFTRRPVCRVRPLQQLRRGDWLRLLCPAQERRVCFAGNGGTDRTKPGT